MILIDTGFLLALSQPADQLHGRAVKWAERITESLIITEYILCETLNALSKRSNRLRGHRLIDWVRRDARYEIIDASPSLFSAGLHLHGARPDKDWSLTDCISFHVMKSRGINRALAYDEHFEQAGFTALLRSDP